MGISLRPSMRERSEEFAFDIIKEGKVLERVIVTVGKVLDDLFVDVYSKGEGPYITNSSLLHLEPMKFNVGDVYVLKNPYTNPEYTYKIVHVGDLDIVLEVESNNKLLVNSKETFDAYYRRI